MDERKATYRKVLPWFVVINALLVFFFVDTWITNDNTASRALSVICFFENGTLSIDKYQQLTDDKCFINGHYYSEKAPLPTFITIPVYGLFLKTGIIKAPDGMYGKPVFIIGAILCGSIPFLIILLISFNYTYKENNFWPVILCMLSLYGSFVFVYSGTFFGHLLSACLLLGCYVYFRQGKYFLAGLIGGVCFTAEYTVAFLLAGWLIILLFNKNKRQAGWYLLGLLPGVAFIMFYNYSFTGSPFRFMYQYVSPMYGSQQIREHYGFIFPSLKALWGLTFSPYKGLFFYSPFLLIVLFYVVKEFSAKRISTYVKHPLLLPVIAYLLFISANQSWNGGWAYGPRQLIVIAVLLIFEGSVYLSSIKTSKAAVSVFLVTGLIITLAAKITTMYSVPSDYRSCLNQLIFPSVFNNQLNNNNILYLLFNISGRMAALIWIGLFLAVLICLYFLIRKVKAKPNSEGIYPEKV